MKRYLERSTNQKCRRLKISRFRVTNRVYVGTVNQSIPLDQLSHPYYKEPSKKFPAGVFKTNYGTALLYKTGKMVINGCSSARRLRKMIKITSKLIRAKINEIKLVNVVGCAWTNRHLNIYRLYSLIPKALYEPELHPGLIFYIENVSVIAYHTGVMMFAGCKSNEQYNSTVVKLRELINKLEATMRRATKK